MTISITEDIKSITELKKNAAQILQQLHTTGRPVVLTVNGKAAAVLLEAKEYERMTQALEMMKVILAAENDVKDGKLRDIAAFFEEFRRDKEQSS